MYKKPPETQYKNKFVVSLETLFFSNNNVDYSTFATGNTF